MIRSNAREAVAERRRRWQDRLENELDRMAGILRNRAGVERVIAFGSVGRSAARYHSDLDIVVIQRTAGRFVDRIEETLRALRPRVPTDVLVYTPEEWNAMRARGGFGRRVEREGRVVYAAAATG